MSYTVNIDDQSFQSDAEFLKQLDLIHTTENTFHLLHNNESYHINLLHIDKATRSLTLEVNGSKYHLKIEDEYDQLVKKMGLSSGASQKMKSIKAPMPGLILDILIKPGQEIQKGDQLLILEAMKMENVLKAEGEGIVKSIIIEKGAAVDKGQLLIEME